MQSEQKNNFVILIIEDELIVAESIAAILENAGYKVCGIAENREVANELFKAHQPHLIISDINLSGNYSGIDIISNFEKTIHTPVIYLTAYTDPETVQSALNTDPASYLTKPFSDHQLLISVNLAIQNYYKTNDSLPYGIEPPTQREREILYYLSKGLNSKQMADKLFLSEHTIKTHRKNLLSKYNVSTMGELILLAFKRKWIKD